MTETIFPVFGALFVLAVVLPIVSLFAKAALLLLERKPGGALRSLNQRYLLLSGSSLIPLAWFLSAGVHQAETGQSTLTCLFAHDAVCFEPGLFALALISAVLVNVALRLRGLPPIAVSDTQRAREVLTRVETLIATAPALQALRGRVQITEDADLTISTHGFARPRVLVDTDFADRLTDDMLVAALAHEAEHVRKRDPLRYLVLTLAACANPFGAWLLRPHFARWYAARETHCDREAVVRGAEPLPLAEAILRAARPSPREAVGLGVRDTVMLKFRVGMLLAFAERRPSRSSDRGGSGLPFAMGLFAVALVLPHVNAGGVGVLDALHTGIERVVSPFCP